MDVELVIVVDDDPVFSRLLTIHLAKNGYLTEAYSCPEDALRRITALPSPDLLLLDFHLGPGKQSGLDICKQIKSSTDLPVIMLTGNDDQETIVECLDAGADQYIVKPYNQRELLARLRAVTRLYKKHDAGTEMEHAGIKLNTISRTLSSNAKQIQLTEKECAAAKIFIACFGDIVERESLYQVLYGIDYNPLNRSVDMLLGRLRKKLEAEESGLTLQPVRNRGYRLISSST